MPCLKLTLSANNRPGFLEALKNLRSDAVADYCLSDVPLRIFAMAIPSAKILIDIVPVYLHDPERTTAIINDVFYRSNYATANGWRVFLCQEKDLHKVKVQRVMAHIIKLLG
jgi:hypothetical protein